jgi:hypothetical protein
MASPAFALYDLCNPTTGTVLYRTCATTTEILAANARLRDRGIPSRYYPAGTYNAPLLHDPR